MSAIHYWAIGRHVLAEQIWTRVIAGSAEASGHADAEFRDDANLVPIQSAGFGVEVLYVHGTPTVKLPKHALLLKNTPLEVIDISKSTFLPSIYRWKWLSSRLK